MSSPFPCASRLGFLAIAGATALTLAACATPSQRLPPGTPGDQVRAEMGRPTLSCPLPDGGERLVWSRQPGGQMAWATNIDAGGRSSGVEQVLTDAGFAQMRKGEWNQDRVRCTFGVAGDIGRVGLPGTSQLVWSYSYRQDTVWNSLMHVFFDDAGYVTHFHPGPDPAYDPDRGFGRF